MTVLDPGRSALKRPATGRHRRACAGFVATRTAILSALFRLLTAPAAAQVRDAEPWWPDRYDVVWTAPSRDSSGSMPLGNGEIGVNVWMTPDGVLWLYVATTDAWSGNSRLLKLGRVRIELSPTPFGPGVPFRQELKLRQGAVEIRGRDESDGAVVTIWVDANQPVVRVDVESQRPTTVAAAMEMWRTQPRQIVAAGQASNDGEAFSAMGVAGGPEPVIEAADTLLSNAGDRIVWYHRNEQSVYPMTMKLQGLESLLNALPDPLLHRTFGACIRGDGLTSAGPGALRSTTAAERRRISIYTLTAQTDSPDEWLRRLDASIAAVDAVEPERAWKEHSDWWAAFWQRSWMHVETPQEARAASRPAGSATAPADDERIVDAYNSPPASPAQGYALQRFINACAGRGAFPIKFNGSLFTVDAREGQRTFDADYRRWGPCYWFQNTRLPYWSMLAAGDFDMMLPLFRMYRAAQPLAEARTRLYFSHDGASFPETIFFWGAYQNEIYGWDRPGKPVSHVDNTYIRYYWSGALELTLMMLDHYLYTGDAAFARETLLPLGASIITFYDQHYRRDERGKLRFEPAASLETWHVAVNPLPEIAGLKAVLPRMLALPEELTTAAQREQWKRMLGELPEPPMREEGGKRFALPAYEFSAEANVENPELYAVWPYRLMGIGKPDLLVGRETFIRRKHPETGGWQHSAIQAAYLGLADEAARMVVSNFTTRHEGSRFPAFWGPNYDWIPDQDHGSVAMIALQRMLLQCEGRQILLLPAWPRDWSVDFKLHAPGKTTIEGTYRRGSLDRLRVTPYERSGDLVRMDSQ
jgi:hypothetical protein